MSSTSLAVFSESLSHSAAVMQMRFTRVFANAQKALQIVHLAMFFDNSRDRDDGQHTHRPVAIIKTGSVLAQHENVPAWWSTIIP